MYGACITFVKYLALLIENNLFARNRALYFFYSALFIYAHLPPTTDAFASESCSSTGIGNAHPSMQHCILILPATPRPPPLLPPSASPPSEHFSVTPTICLRSRGVKRIILWICIGPPLIHIHARVIHNGPLPLPTSDASALISSLLSRFAQAFLRGTARRRARVLSGLSTLYDRNTVTAELVQRCFRNAELV